MTELLEIRLKKINEETLKAIERNDKNIAKRGYKSSQKELGKDYKEINQIRYKIEF